MPRVTDPILIGRICPYCGKESEYVDSSVVYHGKSYGMIYLCRDCDAYVGCYPDGRAMGRLANAELREAKKRAHHYLDQLWETGRRREHKRHIIYNWLSRMLGIPRELTHIGMSDVDQCNRIADLAIARLKEEGIEYEVWPGD